MKRIYHFYLTCMTLTLTMPMMIVSAFAVDDMWTVANNIIVDVYGKIVGVSTVLAGLMSAVAVIGAKLSNMKRRQSSFPRYPENWAICSRNLPESKGHFIRWKSWSRQSSRRQDACMSCWSSAVRFAGMILYWMKPW